MFVVQGNDRLAAWRIIERSLRTRPGNELFLMMHVVLTMLYMMLNHFKAVFPVLRPSQTYAAFKLVRGELEVCRALYCLKEGKFLAAKCKCKSGR